MHKEAMHDEMAHCPLTNAQPDPEHHADTPCSIPLRLIVQPYSVEYPFGQFGPAVPAVPLPISLCPQLPCWQKLQSPWLGKLCLAMTETSVIINIILILYPKGSLYQLLGRKLAHTKSGQHGPYWNSLYLKLCEGEPWKSSKAVCMWHLGIWFSAEHGGVGLMARLSLFWRPFPSSVTLRFL